MDNKRKWIEFGKMWDKMEEMDQFDFGVEYNCSDNSDNSDNEDDQYQTAYDVIKKTYFEKYLMMENTEIIQIELEQELMNQIYKISDEKDITVDEVIIDMLKEYIENNTIEEKECCTNYGPSECCGQCVYYSAGKCKITNKNVYKTFICDDFI